jgi:hypothetical protein
MATRKKTATKRGVSFEEVRALALALPNVQEGTSYGTPAFRWRKQLIARLREDLETLVVKTPPGDDQLILASDPETFFKTPHYDGHDVVLVRLVSVSAPLLAEMLEAACAACVRSRSAAPRANETARNAKRRGR